MRRILAVSLCGALLGLWPHGGHAQQRGTINPHGDLSWDLECSVCHTPTGWKPAKARMDFDHDRETSFVLVGRHREAACTGCHIGARFDEPKVSSNDCATCHVDVHLGNLSDNCAECHSTVSFTDVPGLSVHSRTGFPLTGAHVQLSCESCHIDDRGGAFTALDSDCFACHEADYHSTASPDHAALGFSRNCEGCHATLAWGGGLWDAGGGEPFDHAAVSGGFDLIGAHAAARCESCHIVPGFAPIFQAADESDCIACHQPDYQRAHSGTGFPTGCLTCHTVDNWIGTEFTAHDQLYFPIYSGMHNGVWKNDCRSCHTVPDNFQVFSCIDCHTQGKMDPPHRNVSGYAWVSALCYQCHPDGKKP